MLKLVKQLSNAYIYVYSNNRQYQIRAAFLWTDGAGYSGGGGGKHEYREALILEYWEIRYSQSLRNQLMTTKLYVSLYSWLIIFNQTIIASCHSE